ncbi:hypothetical protein WISP_101109 [Willisornis vidua]|uniref:Uncharacterized protein n=1 Tax=Willisornis vidua TaxID=1566151 RepID=A0ABQ9D3Z8_9PASS|nr:hypothetical protein WISP_101109 [Willisornis vidua]
MIQSNPPAKARSPGAVPDWTFCLDSGYDSSDLVLDSQEDLSPPQPYLNPPHLNPNPNRNPNPPHLKPMVRCVTTGAIRQFPE